MSRIGKKPITVPGNVKVKIEKNRVNVIGPKGEMTRDFHPDIILSLENSIITVSRPSDNRKLRQLHGLTRTLIANMVKGVSEGFEKTLDIVGVGYKGQKIGEKISLQLGFTKPVEIDPPKGVSFQLDNPTRIRVVGFNKEDVGQVAATLRRLKPPDPYKKKGVTYAGERVRQKAGKAGKAGAKK
ncbi:MAG: 50S ribosomal protein L6 [Dehalococcoidia bacterium]|nr:50S ribosomal protein L6 [Dehalococcoidia bacterium]MDZ4246289.1 50S ribosomal protein L6 [Dehalococcoidia bacterium]